ncbi:hypothetical protein F5884DRAFT_677469 [Xylogone sp. PMI_703]|nr:hypothetical protein F5884DRAFT_677469 [Xylogone sp. PMI_703]
MDEPASDGCDISPREYALSNGLALDHLYNSLPLAQLQELRNQDLHTSNIVQFDPAVPPEFTIKIDVDRGLTVSREAVTFLANIEGYYKPGDVEQLVLPLLEQRTRSGLKIDLPLLKTDHNTDCRSFRDRDGFETRLVDIKLPMEVVDSDKNEGLIWPSRYESLSFDIIADLKEEKLPVMRETVQYLQIICKSAYDEKAENLFRQMETKYRKLHALDPVTPPLQPMNLPLSPYEPSSPICDIPLLSDPPSLIKEDLNIIEKSILSQDNQNCISTTAPGDQRQQTSPIASVADEVPKLGTFHSPLASLDNSSSPTANDQHLRKKQLKVEGPLTPPLVSNIPIKSVTFNDVVEQMLLDPWTYATPEVGMQTFFEEALAPLAEQANREIEQERLLEADALGRVKIPIMDFLLAEPEWKKFQACKGTSALAKLQKRLIQNSTPNIPVDWVTIVPPSLLRWNPFQHDLGKAVLKEDVDEGDDIWKTYVGIGDENMIIESSDLAWKRPGLRIVREDESEDDELEPALLQSNDIQDAPRPVNIRKADAEQQIASTRMPQAKRNRAVSSSDTQSNKFQKHVTEKHESDRIGESSSIATVNKAQSGQLTDTNSLLGRAFSESDALDNFLELRGIKRQKLTSSTYFPPKNVNLTPKEKYEQPVEMPQQAHKRSLTKSVLLPAPEISMPAIPITIIVSCGLLRYDRALLKMISNSISSLVIIEREFDKFTTSSKVLNVNSPPISSLSSEADIIISPSVGIILTTLQKIQQKPLPGQKSRSTILDHLEKVSLKYEKLIVFVSEGRDDEMTSGFEEYNCLAFTELVSFTFKLDTDIMVYFVGGGQETLSKWIASSITQHHFARDPDHETPLLEEETHWELFLRRAGMNSFAAQIVIAYLKSPNITDSSMVNSSASLGLAAFVTMTREQRAAMFERILGGKRVLNRVSDLIDATWT